jgi:hypothetical protein
MKTFIASYRWDGRCNAFERRVRVVAAESEEEALDLLKKSDPDIKRPSQDWSIEELDTEYAHVEKTLDIDWS